MSVNLSLIEDCADELCYFDSDQEEEMDEAMDDLMHNLEIVPMFRYSYMSKCKLSKKDAVSASGHHVVVATARQASTLQLFHYVLSQDSHKNSLSNKWPVKVDGINDTAWILCSSGTTKLSKGVSVSHAALIDAVDRTQGIRLDDVLHGCSTLYWVSGVMVLLCGTIRGTTRIITSETFTPELQLRLIERYKVSLTVNSPHHINLILNCELIGTVDLSSLKLAAVGGNKVPLYMKTEMKKYLPNGNVMVSYGMSETASTITVDIPVSYDRDVVGRLTNGSRIKIVDDNGNRCDVNEDGEICVKMRYKFLGYYNNKKATDEVFDDEGFISTGDIGHFDDDGYLYIVDRKKDIMKYYNFPISPSEIEALLNTSPKIKAVCVVGISNSGNDLPAAIVVRADRSDINELEVLAMVADTSADYHKLRGGVYFVDSLPTTASGKVLRRAVLEYATEQFKARNIE